MATKARALTSHFSFYMPPEDTAGAFKYHAYLVIASDWERRGYGVATLLPLTDDTPRPPETHIIVKSGGAKAALCAGEESVANLKENQGLRRMPPARK